LDTVKIRDLEEAIKKLEQPSKTIKEQAIEEIGGHECGK
jgi:hypothetical protein